MEQQRTRRRRILKRLAAVLVGTSLALLIAEGVVRLLELSPEVAVISRGRYQLSTNVRLGYEPVPGVDYQGKSLDFYHYRGGGNALGYRDTDHPLEKPPGTYRILVLGDSVAAGFGVHAFRETFPAILQARLNEQGTPAEVLSFAVCGYNTRQEVETLKLKGLRFAPDLVLLQYCINDRLFMDGGILAALLKESEGKSLPWERSAVLSRSALLRVVWYRVLKQHNVYDRYEALVLQDTVAPSLAELAQLARKHRFKVMVALFPDFKDIEDYAFAEQHRYVAGLAEQHGFQLLDLMEVLRPAGAKAHLDRFHPSALGHRLAAEAMATALAERPR